MNNLPLTLRKELVLNIAQWRLIVKAILFGFSSLILGLVIFSSFKTESLWEQYLTLIFFFAMFFLFLVYLKKSFSGCSLILNKDIIIYKSGIRNFKLKWDEIEYFQHFCMRYNHMTFIFYKDPVSNRKKHVVILDKLGKNPYLIEKQLNIYLNQYKN